MSSGQASMSPRQLTVCGWETSFSVHREDNAEVRRVLDQVRAYTAHCITPLAVQNGPIAGTNGGA
jgi:hypothetical protein